MASCQPLDCVPSYRRRVQGDPAFAARFKSAGQSWDIDLQIAALREKAGLSQKDLAKRLKTSRQQISRLESPSYEGHSLSMLRRVAEVLHARLRIEFELASGSPSIAEKAAPYGKRSARTQRSQRKV